MYNRNRDKQNILDMEEHKHFIKIDLTCFDNYFILEVLMSFSHHIVSLG